LISAGALPQTSLEELTALPRPPAVFKGPTSKERDGVKGKEGKKRGENRRRKEKEGKGKGNGYTGPMSNFFLRACSVV